MKNGELLRLTHACFSNIETLAKSTGELEKYILSARLNTLLVKALRHVEKYNPDIKAILDKREQQHKDMFGLCNELREQLTEMRTTIERQIMQVRRLAVEKARKEGDDNETRTE